MAEARSVRSRGWWLATLLAPQIVIGTWLIVVPDRIAFTASQAAVLLHVALGLVTLPPFLVWLWRHARGRALRSLATDGGRLPSTARHLLTLLALLALGSGLGALWSGEGTFVGALHGAVGIACGAPLALHLFLEQRRAAAAVVAVCVVGVAGGSALLKRVLPGQSLWPEKPRFEFATVPTQSYDAASWCGECHGEIYDEWRHSTHSRAIKLPSVRRDFQRLLTERPRTVVDATLVTATTDPSGICSHCHTPLTFYGDDPTPVLDAGPPVNDGVSCSFCHTARGLRSEGPVLPETWAGANFYRSGPSTVRRYLGQAARSPALHAIGNWLIRWRPEMHRRDYDPPFLRTSEACRGCHGLILSISPFDDWRKSRFSAGGPGRATHCQDCHMARAVTGKPVEEPGRLVGWGARRPQRRSHLFPGGNVRAAEESRDEWMAARERELSRLGVRVAIEDASRDGDHASARVVLKNELVGHRFPNMETTSRYAWVELSALDEAGRALATTPPPPDNGRLEQAVVPVLYQRGNNTNESFHDSTLPSGASATYPMRVDLGAAAGRARRLRAAVYHAFDSQPIAVATVDLPR
jgi:hypothetical protein